MAFLFNVEIFDVEYVFYLFFGNNFNICYKKVLTLSLTLSTMAPKSFLVVLVFFIGMVLVNRRLLLFIKYINKEDVSGFIFLKVFILFFC